MSDLVKSFRLGELVVEKKEGLTAAQVAESREKYGRNELTPPPRTPWWKQLLEKFNDPTIKILLAAAFVSLAMAGVEKWVIGNEHAGFMDSIGIFLAVGLATLVGYYSERNSEKAFEMLNKVKDDIQIEVLRGGRIQEVSIHELVVGDRVQLHLGDKIPADGVVLESTGMLVDQAILTGESAPVEKLASTLDESEDWLSAFQKPAKEGGFAENQRVFKGTMINDGHGVMLVTAVGDSTEMGKIAGNLADDESKAPTPLVGKLTRLTKQISVLGVTAAMVIFTVMAVKACLETPLLKEFCKEMPEMLLLGAVSVVLGWVALRFLLKPFFRSLDLQWRSPLLSFLAMIPAMAAIWIVGMCLWGMIFLPETVAGGLDWDAEAVNLLQNVLISFVIAVTIIVVSVPEGLPMMVTVSLAMNMMKMARENCLVRKLVASETIGSATIICSDKTGTLTQNQMQPVWFFAPSAEEEAWQEYRGEAISQFTQTPEWERFAEGVCVNSTGNLDVTTEGIQRIGNATECALLAFLHQSGVDYPPYREKYPRMWELSHNSQRKMSFVCVRRSENYTIYLKGAPERVLEKCSGISLHGTVCPMETYRETLRMAIEKASGEALRILAIAERNSEEAPSEEEFSIPNDFTLLALVGIMDPIREEVPPAVQTCREAGIQVKMITGDALPTAVAIAKNAGILTHEPDTEELVLTSDDLADVSEEELPDVARRLRVLARSTPSDKLRLVKALQRVKEVVAMTGDGTNDAPALKRADVGLSMGITGTEVAKEASDIILVDDNFKSIVTGVHWGRTLYHNIQRFLQFQLSVNVVALICALLGPMVGVPLPFTVTQLLWINIIMDTFAAIGYSTDPPRQYYMHQRPISRDAHIITPSMLFSILANSLFQVVILFAALKGGWFLPETQHFVFGQSPTYAGNIPALTVFFTIFVMFQFWHKFNCRSLMHSESPFQLLTKNRLFMEIVLVITVVQVLMVQASGYMEIGTIFRTVALSWQQWLGITLLTATILPFAWLCRQVEYWLGFESSTG